MSNFRNVTVRGRVFKVRAGDVLLDGALANGVEIPHDCRAGTCGTCLVQVKKGQTVCGETHTRGMVHACQAWQACTIPRVWVSPQTVWPFFTCTRQVPQVPARQSCGISTPLASAPSSRTSPARTLNTRPLTVTFLKLLIVHSSIGSTAAAAMMRLVRMVS